MDYKKLAELLFPHINITTEEIEKKYPKRNLLNGQMVTRYAPSPTGYMHIGNFFQMYISYNLAKNTNGKFFVRVEDTDEKRRVEGALEVIYEILNKFNIKIDEYQTLDGVDIGAYGPYVQSQRGHIYGAYAKKLVAEGKAFPCFCRKTEGKEDVLELRKDKFLEDDEKEYDPCRDLPLEVIEEKLKNNEPFAIRLKTKNDGSQRVKFYDLIKGEIDAKANAKDFILLKSDGIPPYAFAHAIDDTLMGTTIVVRGEEYISSTPMHIELFEALGFPLPTYCHNPLICKIGENGNRRKVSKRYDPEADMRFYFEEGYPCNAVLEYLLNLINSGFEGWREQNPDKPWQEFKFGIKDITTVAPIFDMVKFGNVSKNCIARMDAASVYNHVLEWAGRKDVDFYNILSKNKDYALKVFNIERENLKPRKDIEKWSDVKGIYTYMFNDLHDKILAKQALADFVNAQVAPKNFNINEVNKILSEYANNYNPDLDKQEWFNGIKQIAKNNGFADDNKLYKANPDAFKGSYADVAALIRVALTGRTQSLDLYEVCQTLGKEEIINRLS